MLQGVSIGRIVRFFSSGKQAWFATFVRVAADLVISDMPAAIFDICLIAAFSSSHFLWDKDSKISQRLIVA